MFKPNKMQQDFYFLILIQRSFLKDNIFLEHIKKIKIKIFTNYN